MRVYSYDLWMIKFELQLNYIIWIYWRLKRHLALAEIIMMGSVSLFLSQIKVLVNLLSSYELISSATYEVLTGFI